MSAVSRDCIVAVAGINLVVGGTFFVEKNVVIALFANNSDKAAARYYTVSALAAINFDSGAIYVNLIVLSSAINWRARFINSFIVNVGKFVACIRLNQIVQIAVTLADFGFQSIKRFHEIFVRGHTSKRCRRNFILAEVRFQRGIFFHKRRVFVRDSIDSLIAAFEKFLGQRDERFKAVSSPIYELADVVSVVVINCWTQRRQIPQIFIGGFFSQTGSFDFLTFAH